MSSQRSPQAFPAMSSNLEFVLEEPQSSAQGKKRLRLVTSCDHCRIKKIKCIQHPTSGSCEACHAASISCQYRDREQYFAERARIVTGPTAALRDASPNAQPGVQLSAFNASGPSCMTPPTPRTPARTPPTVAISTAAALSRSISPGYYPFVDMNELDFGPFQDMLGAFAAHGAAQVMPDPPPSLAWCPPRDPELHDTMVLQLPPIQIPVLPCPSLGLFDPDDLVQPHPKLMMDFIHVFFEHLGKTYTFLCPAAICQDFLHERLSPLLANVLAAGAAEFSTFPAVHKIGAANVSDVYCHMAKVRHSLDTRPTPSLRLIGQQHMIPPEGTPATLETLHAIMLLAWAERKRGKQESFAQYAAISRRLAMELDITPLSLPRLTQSMDTRMNCILKATLEHVEAMESIIAAECPHLLSTDAGIWFGMSG
ncbi:hypothetical protein BN946_scf185042.g160 [Trametes cinnabarina]|uniref:Zn(2)-C6 fungal-type domain-containing protein n=1 Tax=Pycnoporus cinnabarinus TaxID=5643 RepID=A0A060SA54_PYCCI|nr:hypothetical protein BN946_scf185042.g160 [Trametes cinnabarina]